MFRKYLSLAALLSAFIFHSESNAQTISLYAGSPTGVAGWSDGTGLTTHLLHGNEGICFDKNGAMYVADATNNRIRKIVGTTISTIGGTGTAGYTGDGGAATAATMNTPYDVTVDTALNVYFTDEGNGCVREIFAATDEIITLAGTGNNVADNYNGDGAPATNYTLSSPIGITIGKDGYLYVGDQFNYRIRRITTTGTITISTFAGGSTGGFSGDGGVATAALISYPTWVRFNLWGDLYFWDRENERMRRITAGATPAQNIISTVVGFGTSGYVDDVPATSVEFSYLPGGLAFDGAGNLYFADRSNYRVREGFIPEIPGSNGAFIGSDTVKSICGTGTSGYTGNGGAPATAELDLPVDVLTDSTGNYWISDAGANEIRYVDVYNGRPRFVNGHTETMTVCENSVADSFGNLLNITDSNATVAQLETWNILRQPRNGIAYAFDTTRSDGGTLSMKTAYYTPAQNFSGTDSFWVWVNDGLSIDTMKITVTVKSFYAGLVTPNPNLICPGAHVTLSSDSSGGVWSSSSTYVATVSSGLVTGVSGGNAFISYTITNSCGSASSAARVIVGDPIINTYAGTGAAAYTGDGAAATAATLNSPHGISVDPSTGYIYICDVLNNAIRMVNPATGIITTIAGTGVAGYDGEGVAIAKELNQPFEVLADGHGDVYVTDYANNRVREVDASANISTIAGNGTLGSTGDGLAATNAEIYEPTGLAMDASGNIYFSEADNKVRMVNISGIITTVAGTGVLGFSGDGGAATLAELKQNNYIKIDPYNNLYIVDNGNQRIREVNRVGIISTVAGTGVIGTTGDNGPATAAELNYPGGLTFDRSGNMYIAADVSETIRMVSTEGIISTIAGDGSTGYTGNGGPATAATMHTVVDVALDAAGNMYIADQQNNVIRKVSIQSPTVPAITGTIPVCVNSSITLANDTLDGLWSSANNAVATVVGATGTVTGVSQGTTLISYAIQFECGTMYATTTETVDPLPNVINGNMSACVGATSDLTDGGGGTWSSSTIAIGTVGSGTGVVTGIFSGTTVITYTLPTGCARDTVFTVSNTPGSITGNAALCVGSSETLSVTGYSGTWISSNPSVASIGTLTGTMLGVTAGTAVVTFSIGTGCSTTTIVTVVATPSAITGNAPVCVNSSITLIGSPGGGTWSSSIVTAGTINSSGSFTGISSGSSIISYILSDGCQANTIATVNPLPSPITGTFIICDGGNTTLTSGVGGTWTSGNTAVATIVAGTGYLTGVAIGRVVISYTLSTGCYQTTSETITTAPGPITGATSLCVGGTSLLGNTVPGGTWSTSGTAVGTISTGGTFTGISAGSEMVTYSLGTGCIATTFATVNPVPASIGGSDNVCLGLNTTLTETTGSGVWGTSDAMVAAVSSGTVTGTGVGTATISYTLASGCSATLQFTVNALPNPISGTTSICTGTSSALSDATSGGTWNSANGAVAIIVTGSGYMTGAGQGTTTVTYTLSTGCMSATGVTVNLTPGGISGATSLCVGSATLLTDVTGGGSWQSGNTSIAMAGSGTGSVTGVSAGTTLISYITPNGCSNLLAMSVIYAPATISGSGAICLGSTETLGNTVSGGTWTSGNAGVATVGTGTGFVTSVTTGTAFITYTVASGCYVTLNVTVNPNPAAITPAGAVNVCPGMTTLLGDITTGGAWSSSNTATATVAGATVTGVSSGVVNISYTLATGCYALHAVTVNVAPEAISPANPTLCTGAGTTFTDGTSGGDWVSSTISTATVGSLSGAALGVGTGSSIITYTINGCYVTTTVTVTGLLSAGTITGPAVMCATSPVTLTDPASGGIWVSGNTSVATVGVSTGSVSGVGSGTVIISYVVTNMCGSAYTTHSIDVSTLSAGTISGSSLLCAGTDVLYSDAAPSGSWTVANSSATITGGGLLIGITSGTNIVTYTEVNTCGTTYTTKPITIGAYLTAGTITGSGTSMCAGATISVADMAPGGTWSMSNGNAALSGSIVTGVSGGVDSVEYTTSSSCGSATAYYVVTVNPLPAAGSISGPTNICLGTPVTYTDAVTGGTWSIANASATISGSGTVTPATTGTNIVTYTFTNVCGTAYTTENINIGSLLTAGTISGPAYVCVGSSITLTDGTMGGTWSAANTAATLAGGTVTGVSAGTDIISYTVTSSCGATSVTQEVVVYALPNAGVITGPPSVCLGSAATYTVSATGGYWGMANSTATISGGVVTPIATGTNVVSYTVSNVCGSANATENIAIGISPSAGTITGASMICTGAPVTLTDAETGGVWSASNTNATISGTGLVTASTAGLDTIAYTVTNSCGTAVATDIITVNISADAGTIHGPSIVCAGTYTLYVDSAAGGNWSLSNGNAVITTAGVLSALVPGTNDTVLYSVTNACGTATATEAIALGALLDAGTITGVSGVCIGSSVTLTDAATGGAWSSSNPSVATVSSGTVLGVTAGTTTISYTVTLPCGTAAATTVVTVSALATAGTIIGPYSLCAGSEITLLDPTSGGVWSTTNSNATVSTGGMVTGILAGNDTIIYTVTNYCGTAATTHTVTINPVPVSSSITGPTSVCAGVAVVLTDAMGGGTWYSSNVMVAAIGAGTGVVTGVSGGTATMSYLISGSCGSSLATYMFTVNSLPAAGSISGPGDVCVGSVINLTDAAPGGAWGSANTNATVTFSGAVTGITTGLDTIKYTVTNVCGIASATFPMAISVFPTAGTVSGPLNVCLGTAASYSDGIAGGTWSSSNTAVALIGTLTGIANGVTTGSANIIYTVTNACGTAAASMAINVDPTLSAGSIAGADSLCPGSSLDLTDTVSGGAWGASNGNATVSIAGVVTGVAAGLDTMYYSVTSVCGTVLATKQITILPIPSPGMITGNASVCTGGTDTLADATTGGTWSAGGTDATVSGMGVVTGVTPGTVTILYVVTNICGTNTDSKVLTVNAGPTVMPITGDASECTGFATTLHDATSGGAWTSNNTAVASIGEYTGIVTGVTAGTTTLAYTVTDITGCSTVVTVMDTVGFMPAGAPITGMMNVCAGAATTLADAEIGGSWTSALTGIATVDATTGTVTGVSAGTDKIYYTLTGTCGSVVDSAIVTVNATPTAGTISASSTTACSGIAITLTDVAAGGVWGSENTTVATVTTGGVVTGLTAGTAIISYKVTNTAGCIATATIGIVIGVESPSGSVSPGGTETLCHGNTVTLHVTSTTATTYQWLRGGSPIAGADAATYVANTAGSYEVEIGNGSCSATLTGPSVVAPPTPVISYTYPNELMTSVFATYQWYLNGTAIAGANSEDYFYTTGGNYTVVVTDGGCADSSLAYAVSGITSVGNVTGNETIQVYPNPVSGLLHIVAPQKVTAIVTAVDGSLLMNIAHATDIDMSSLADGLYILEIFDENNILVKTTKVTKMN